jgi:hypothetical protein
MRERTAPHGTSYFAPLRTCTSTNFLLTTIGKRCTGRGWRDGHQFHSRITRPTDIALLCRITVTLIWIYAQRRLVSKNLWRACDPSRQEHIRVPASRLLSKTQDPKHGISSLLIDQGSSIKHQAPIQYSSFEDIQFKSNPSYPLTIR